MVRVIKRDGTEVDFDKNKIYNAVEKACAEVGLDVEDISDVSNSVMNSVMDEIIECNINTISVEDIQDMVETELMGIDTEVAKVYITYRYQHAMIRDNYRDFMDSVKDKIMATNVQNQNANVDERSFGGRKGEAANELLKKFALDYCMSEMAKSNHMNNMIYIHDLDSYAIGCHNCLTIPLDPLLANGFNTRQVDIRPANSISTALQLVAVIDQLQSLQQFGGVSASHLDWTLVPYVRKSFSKHMKDALRYIEECDCEEYINSVPNELRFDDKEANEPIHAKAYKYAMDMTIKETRQAVEGLYHNLNSLQSRSGNQLPFTSINYGTCTLPEGRLVIKSLLEGSIKGVGRLHKTSVFPCGIFQCMNEVNRKEGDPNYDLFQLALKSTAKRLYPNYANVDWSGNAGYDKNDPRTIFSTMGCRTANGFDINAEPNQNPQLKDGRGNICPVTIIMPTLAMIAKESIGKLPAFAVLDEPNEPQIEATIRKFMSLLDQKIYEAKDMLIERFEFICNQNPDSAKFMYENNVMYGYKPEEGIRSALKHGTLALGQIGLAETLQILIGCDHTEEKGMELAKRIEQLFKDRCAKFKQEYKLNFGVYYTPAENLCYTAMQKFKNKYGVIPNVSDKDFFTNSMHIPVWKRISPFDKIDLESQLTGYSSAGCITYVELSDEDRNNLDAVEAVVQYAMDKDIPYFAINVPCDTCMECGDCGEIPDECSKCGSNKIQRLRRVTGYLTGDYKSAFNKGKQQEVEMRVKHH